jgi:hypothetical protein
MWFFFTILAGVLPLGFKWVICGMTDISFTYSSVCSEIFFFNVILSANGLKELYDIDSEKKLKILLFASLVFILIILSAFYGVLLLNDYRDMKLNLENIYLYSKIFTFLGLIVNFSIQILGGVDTDD